MSGGVETTRVVGRYAIFQAIASGGMATVYLGRLLGPVGFARTVAIKRLHPQYASEAKFVSMFLDEGRLAARIRHPNVVSTLDVVATNGELFLVMDYVHGEPLGKLVRVAAGQESAIPVPIVVAIMSGALQGLQAAHEAKSERGVPLQIIHRDVSPQNILVGRDGTARLLDFGVARAEERLSKTQEGQVKGKVAYMAPEQLRGEELGPPTDIYAAAVVMWEALTGKRLYGGLADGHLVVKVLESRAERPSEVLLAVGDATRAKLVEPLDDIVMKALAPKKEDRWQSARELSRVLEAASPSATAAQVSDWVEATAGPELRERASIVADIESSSALDLPPGAVAAIGETTEAHPVTVDEIPATTMDPQPTTLPLITRKDDDARAPLPSPDASPARKPTITPRPSSRPNGLGPLPATLVSAPSPMASKPPLPMATLQSIASPIKPAIVPPPENQVSVATPPVATMPPTPPVTSAPPTPPAESVVLPMRRSRLKVFIAVVVVAGLIGGAVAYFQSPAPKSTPKGSTSKAAKHQSYEHEQE